jgi:CHAP domain
MPRRPRLDSPQSALLKAQQASLGRGERIDTMMLTAVARRAAGIDVADALTSAKVTLTIAGASTLELTVEDPDWLIEGSGLTDPDRNGRLDPVAVTVDRLRFRLVKSSRAEGATSVTLTFEDEVYALLRAHRSRISSSRGSMTRAQFIERMVREVKLRDIPFWSPEKGRAQPRALPDFPDITPPAPTDSGGKKKAYTQETWAAALLQALSIEQTPANMQALVGWERAEGGHWQNDAKFNPLNTTQSMPGSTSINSVGVKAYRSWEQGFQATVKTLHNGHYGPILSALKSSSPAAVANAIDASPWGTATGLIQRSVAGAPSKLRDVDGGGGGPSSDGAETHDVVRSKAYRFTRGLPGQSENSVQAATRLADEVAWRFFALGGVVGFVTDPYLLTLPAVLVLEGFDDAGLLGRPGYEWDSRKLAANVTFQALADAWSVPPAGILAWRDVPKPIEGRWIVETVEFDLLKPAGCDITLTKPTSPKKEPAPELFTVAIGESAGDTPQGGDPAVGGVKKAIAWARSRIGHYAEEHGNNRGDELDQLERQAPFHMEGAPWCAIFATTVLVMGGVPRACRTAAVLQIRAWAQAGTHGYQRGFRATPEPGDLVTWDWGGNHQHVGFIEKVQGRSITTIEGNTGASKVVRKTHPIGDGQYVRPEYPED